MERLCLPPVTIATAIVTVTMIPMRLFCMIQLFSKMLSQHHKDILAGKANRRRRCVPISTQAAHEAERLV